MATKSGYNGRWVYVGSHWGWAPGPFFGRRVYAVGGNERAAELSGVPVKRIQFSVYVISSVCAAMVGLIIAAQVGTPAVPW